jgi:UDP-2-acetamido-3-amino-2,3-dideoxy-glucuronate N-acetyltransferase
LDDFVFCGPSMVFTNVMRPRSAFPTGSDRYARTRVETGATLGANCTIVCGSTVGAWSFVAAGAVVTKDVAPHSLVAGVPARHIGWVSRAGQRLTFENGEATCPETGHRYVLRDGRALEVGQPGAADPDVERRAAALANTVLQES